MMSKSTKVTLAVVGLVIIMALSHRLTGTTLNDIVANKPGAHHDHDHEQEATQKQHGKKVTLPAPIGPEKAAVKVKVYVTTDNECDTTTLNAMKTLGTKYGDKIRVEFADLLEAHVKREAEKAKIGCKTGITVNGQTKFILPERGLAGTIMLDGPLGMKNYKLSDLEAIIEHELRKSQESKPSEKPRHKTG